MSILFPRHNDSLPEQQPSLLLWSATWRRDRGWHQFPHGSPSQAFETTHPSLHMCDIHLRRPSRSDGATGKESGPFSLLLFLSCQQQHIASLSHYLLKNSRREKCRWWSGMSTIMCKSSWVTRTLFRLDVIYFNLNPQYYLTAVRRCESKTGFELLSQGQSLSFFTQLLQPSATPWMPLEIDCSKLSANTFINTNLYKITSIL